VGERFGHTYVNHVRRYLAHQAIAVAGAGGPGRFGTVAMRMTGDLTAVKDWANKGACGGVAGSFGLLGGLTAAWLAAGPAGLLATLAGPILAVLIFAACLRPLHDRVRTRRRDKGRLSAKIGDLLLGAAPSAAYAAEKRAIKPVKRAGEAVLESACRETALTTLMMVPALLTLPLGAAAAIILSGYGLSPTDGVAGWAALLFALTLVALSLSLLATAVVQIVERSIAVKRLHKLMHQARELPAATPRGTQRLKPGAAVALSVDGQPLLEAGALAVRPRNKINQQLPALLRGEAQVSMDGQPASEFYPADWARRIAYAGPMRPLKRGTLVQILAAKRNAGRAHAESALLVCGLDIEMIDSEEIIDPGSPDMSEWTLARLRLARALAHRPRALVIDDPWLLADNQLTARVMAHCLEANISLLMVSETDDCTDMTVSAVQLHSF